MKTLNLLQSFCRADLSENDLGYLSKWLMVDYNNVTIEEYIEKIESMTILNFFDRNKTIQTIIDKYKQLIDLKNESELNALENQSLEC